MEPTDLLHLLRGHGLLQGCRLEVSAVAPWKRIVQSRSQHACAVGGTEEPASSQASSNGNATACCHSFFQQCSHLFRSMLAAGQPTRVLRMGEKTNADTAAPAKVRTLVFATISSVPEHLSCYKSLI